MSQSLERWRPDAEAKISELKRLQGLGLINRGGEFLPAVHYPPITMYRPMTETELFRDYRPADGLFDVYIHIPFCEKQCVFCHYPVKLGKQTKEKEKYLAALAREMDIYVTRLGVERVKARSLLIGGGTPTYLTPAQLEKFHRELERRIDVSAATQFNYDFDPLSVLGPEGAERVDIMRAHGVDRVTIGVQSLSDDVLRKMNRTHDVAQALAAIEVCRKAGFTVNIELIFGYPGVSLEMWARHMEQAVALDVDEIQLYRLKIIPYGDHRGAITRIYKCRMEDFHSVEDTIAAKQVAHSILHAAGFHEEPNSRVFRRDTDSRHHSHYAFNQCCALLDEVGFGLTAFSSLHDRFGLNTLSFPEYYASIDQGRLPMNRGLVRSREDQIRWSLILPLKNGRIQKDLFLRRTGAPLESVFPRKIEKLAAAGLLEWHDWGLKLTPMGRFFSDEVVQQFYLPEHLPCPRSEYAEGDLNPFRDNELGP